MRSVKLEAGDTVVYAGAGTSFCRVIGLGVVVDVSTWALSLVLAIGMAAGCAIGYMAGAAAARRPSMPRTRAEFDRLTLVEPRNAVPPENCDAISPSAGDPDSLSFRAETKYGGYSRLGNAAIADSPLGRLYFAWDESGNSVSVLDIKDALTPDGKPVRAPQDCKTCHEKKPKL